MIDQGKLGTISNLDISQAHDYHGMSVMRRLLGTGMENCRITARTYDFPVNYHCGREGLHKGEKTIVDTRKRAEFVFPDGKVGFFDFAGEQYFNYFRTRHLTLQGDCGEVHDQQAAWLGQDGYPVRGSIQRDELGQYSNLEGYGMRSLRLNGEILYRNPYADRDLRLTDEEIAVAQMMEGMKTYVETGKEVYPLEKVDSVKPLNIIYLILDSWNFRTFTRECCPNIRAFGDRSAVFNRHLSSSNGTRGGIFGLFFGISATYWQDFERTGVQPLFIENLLENGYDIETFASATLVNPPFYRIVFGDVKDIRKETPGATPFDRDNRITEDFLNYLDERKDVNKPFFSFVFYDLLHAIDIPAPYRKKFQPSWDYANYLALNNNLDPEPFFNLYRNCAYYVDSLVGKVVNKLEANGLLDNSVIVITGDHGQEFNENKKNFWGHGSDFSNAQVHVPFILYYPGNTPGVYSHRTSHYDVTPTLMKRVLGVKNPAEDYSMGRDLFDPERPPFHLAGDPQNYAFIMDNVIYEKKVAGNIQVTDSLLNRLSRNQINSGLLLKAIEFKNMFLKK